MSATHFVILGNGISGITFARHLRKGNPHVQITVISGESPYFFSRTALMYVYMGQMKWEHLYPYELQFWGKNRITLKQAWVTALDVDAKKLSFDTGEDLSYDYLILATGSTPAFYDWPGQHLQGVQGLYTKQDLESMEINTSTHVNRAVVVGGGLIGIEMVEMLAYRKIPVTFMVRESRFWEQSLPKQEADLVHRLLKEQDIDLRLGMELKEILPGVHGKVRAVRTSQGEEISCEFVGLATGVTPNVAFLKKSGIKIQRGVLVNSYFETSAPNVYAIGDCAEFEYAPGEGRKNIEQVWYTGRMHGETLAANFCTSPQPYAPGVWFNSAKFFEIEYQTYGVIAVEEGDEIQDFYWEHPSGKIAFRMQMDAGGKILGVLALGFRLRHEYFDRAIREGWSGLQVISTLHQANFDPEFFAPHHVAIQKSFQLQFGVSFPLPKRSLFHHLFGSSS